MPPKPSSTANELSALRVLSNFTRPISRVSTPASTLQQEARTCALMHEGVKFCAELWDKINHDGTV